MAALAPTLATTTELLRDLRDGDRDAERRVYERCLPALRRWAHGRMPRTGHGVGDTDELVQATLRHALHSLHEFESSGSRSFLAHLRDALLDEARTRQRTHRCRDALVDVDACTFGGDDDSAVGHLVGHGRMRAYEEALATLDRRQRERVVLRLEFGMDEAEIARETGTRADAVRTSLTRALKAMTRHMVAARAA